MTPENRAENIVATIERDGLPKNDIQRNFLVSMIEGELRSFMGDERAAMLGAIFCDDHRGMAWVGAGCVICALDNVEGSDEPPLLLP